MVFILIVYSIFYVFLKIISYYFFIWLVLIYYMENNIVFLIYIIMKIIKIVIRKRAWFGKLILFNFYSITKHMYDSVCTCFGSTMLCNIKGFKKNSLILKTHKCIYFYKII
jgi:hypothetical protein